MCGDQFTKPTESRYGSFVSSPNSVPKIQSSGLNPRKTANSAHCVRTISACSSYGFAMRSLCAWKLSERSPGPCKSGVTIWLKPLVVAKEEGALATITIITTSAANSIRLSLAPPISFCKAFATVPRVKPLLWNLSNSVLTPNAFGVEHATGDPKITAMRVLAIDASLRNTGVAIVDANNGKPRSLYFGTIHNAGSMRSSSCLVVIRDRLVELIREHEPDCCALESVIYVQSYKTAIVLGAARGAAILAAAEMGLPVFEYAPNRIKQATVGTGAAGKNQVAFIVRSEERRVGKE